MFEIFASKSDFLLNIISEPYLSVVRQLRTQPELGLRTSEVRLGRRRSRLSQEQTDSGAGRQIGMVSGELSTATPFAPFSQFVILKVSDPSDSEFAKARKQFSILLPTVRSLSY